MSDDVVKFVGVKEMVAVLRQVEPELLKQLRKDIRSIAAPAVSSIRSNVPSIAPLSGMSNGGRLAWSGAKVSVSITPNQRSVAWGSTTSNLAAILTKGVSGQGLVIADMAGRGGGKQRKNNTRVYPYKGGQRSHRVNGQGQAMIRNLAGKPSRYVYPAIERQLPAVRVAVADSIESMAKTINAKIERI